MIYMVTYSLRPRRNAKQIVDVLQSFPDWAHYIDDTWLILTYENPEEIYLKLVDFLRDTDHILITRFDPLQPYYGFLPQEAWDWIEQYKYR